MQNKHFGNTFFVLLFIPQGKPNYKVFNIEYFIEQLLVEKKLYDIKLVDSPNCLYCNNIDNINHFLLSCKKTRNFGQSFFLWWNRVTDRKITIHHEFLEESIFFGFQMNGEVFDILNYCKLNVKFYIHKQKLFHENALDCYDYLWELKYKQQIERKICNGTNNDKQFSKLLFINNAL